MRKRRVGNIKIVRPRDGRTVPPLERRASSVESEVSTSPPSPLSLPLATTSINCHPADSPYFVLELGSLTERPDLDD